MVVRQFRNLADGALDIPPDGIALLGPNGHGKTNLLEALAYPVLFRSLRGARDSELARFGGPGFHVSLQVCDGPLIETTWEQIGARKTVTVGGSPTPRITDGFGHWLAVAFLPSDPMLVEGGAAERRRWLDRLLSLADPAYLGALLRYRAALAQRGAALRQGQAAMARAFDGALAEMGSKITARRLDWMARASEEWQGELDRLGESAVASLHYRGDTELCEAAAWSERLDNTFERDQARGQTHVGPHRDDLLVNLAGRSLRRYGSTGQHRTAAIGLRLLEHATLAQVRGVIPALLVDDVFAELDADRQHRLAARLGTLGAQLVVTAPRDADVPESLEIPRWHVDSGRIRKG